MYGALVDLALRQAKLHGAATYWSKSLQSIQEQQNWGHLPLPLIGWVYIRIGEILYEWNNLVGSWDHLSQGLERAELGGDILSLIAGYVIAGRLRLTEGDIGSVVEFLEMARPLVKKAHFTDWSSRFERFQLELWLVQDEVRLASDWTDQMLSSRVVEDRPKSKIVQPAIICLLIVKGDVSSLEGSGDKLTDRA